MELNNYMCIFPLFGEVRERLFCICARVGYVPGLECSTEEHGIDATVGLRSTVYK